MIDREEKIRELLPLVRKIARRIAGVIGGSDIDDLIGDGSVGLIRAVDSYDARYGVALDQYARRVIAGAMLNGIRRLDPVSERVRRTLRNAERERYALASQQGSMPTLHEMRERVPGLERARAEAHRGTPLSTDAPFPGGERFEIAVDGDPQVIISAAVDRSRIRSAIATLPHRQRKLIVDHYYGDQSLRVLGDELGVSPQRASQLHLLAIGRLRRELVPA
jgi:RNA polymerase sigma factor for flagellar operon FliA